MLPNFSVLRWSPTKTVEPTDAVVEPMRAPDADVTVPMAEAGAPQVGNSKSERDTTTASTACGRNITASVRGPEPEYRPLLHPSIAIRRIQALIPYLLYEFS